MDFSSMLGGLGGGGSSGPTSKEFGSSTASTTITGRDTGRDGGLTPAWAVYAALALGAITLLLVLFPRR
jgi:hypothetical protein